MSKRENIRSIRGLQDEDVKGLTNLTKTLMHYIDVENYDKLKIYLNSESVDEVDIILFIYPIILYEYDSNYNRRWRESMIQEAYKSICGTRYPVNECQISISKGWSRDTRGYIIIRFQRNGMYISHKILDCTKEKFDLFDNYLQIFSRHGAKIVKDSTIPQPIHEGDLSFAKEWIENATTLEMTVALEVAIIKKDISMVEYLLQMGAKPDFVHIFLSLFRRHHLQSFEKILPFVDLKSGGIFIEGTLMLWLFRDRSKDMPCIHNDPIFRLNDGYYELFYDCKYNRVGKQEEIEPWLWVLHNNGFAMKFYY